MVFVVKRFLDGSVDLSCGQTGVTGFASVLMDFTRDCCRFDGLLSKACYDKCDACYSESTCHAVELKPNS